MIVHLYNILTTLYGKIENPVWWACVESNKLCIHPSLEVMWPKWFPTVILERVHHWDKKVGLPHCSIRTQSTPANHNCHDRLREGAPRRNYVCKRKYVLYYSEYIDCTHLCQPLQCWQSLTLYPLVHNLAV